MASHNEATIIGNLGADPEVKSFQNGCKVCNFRVACTESWKDKASGEKKERTEWISIAIFNEGLAGIAERFLKKGSRVMVIGQLRTRKWQDQSGNDRYSTEVVLQGPRAVLTMLGDGGGQRSEHQADETTTHYGSQSSGSAQDDLDDEIPF